MISLFILIILNTEFIGNDFWWHFFYGSNFYFWNKGSFGGSLSHFWSLSVEEQFYLIWPAIILMINQKHITRLLIGGIIIGFLFKLYIVNQFSDIGRILLPGSLDSFCIGGLLMYARKYETRWYKKYQQNQKIFLLIFFAFIIVLHFPIFNKLSASLQAGQVLLLENLLYE